MAFQKERRVLQVNLVVPFVFGNGFAQTQQALLLVR